MSCCVVDSAVSVLRADQTARILPSSYCNIVHFRLRFSGTFRDSLSVAFSSIELPFLLDCGLLMIGPICCPETSVINYQSTLRRIPNERRPLVTVAEVWNHALLLSLVNVLQAEFFIVPANTTAVAQIILRRQVCFSVNPGFLYSKIFVTEGPDTKYFLWCRTVGIMVTVR